MTYDPHKHHRRSIRLKGYDYSQAGVYFITICVKGGLSLLSKVELGHTRLNTLGEIVTACWLDLPNHYPHVELDAFVVMPNHIHGIVLLVDADNARTDVGAGFKPALTKPAPTEKPAPTKRHGLPEIVRAFKTFSARRINAHRDTTGTPFWQRNYYEHIIRNERALNAIREYIHNNPANWEADKLHPDAPPNTFNQLWSRS